MRDVRDILVPKTGTMRTQILYTPVKIVYNEETRNIAGAMKDVCDGLSEAGTIGYYWGSLTEIAGKLGLVFEGEER